MADRKAFVIPPFRPNVNMDSRKAEGIWGALRAAIDEIYKRNASSLSFEELYRSAYNLVLHKYGHMLYSGVRDTVTEHLKSEAARVVHVDDDRLLRALQTAWKDHSLTMSMIRDIMMYMDRTFVTQHKRKPVYYMGLDIFRENIVCHRAVRDRLQRILLRVVDRERRGELIERDLVRDVLSMLVEVGVGSRTVYEDNFERQFLEETELFYRNESAQFISSHTCPQYLQRVEQRLQEEQDRVAHYLHTSTEKRLREICERELIARHAPTLIADASSGAVAMFLDDRVDDLTRMYRLFRPVSVALTGMRECMEAQVRSAGQALVADPATAKEPVRFVQGLLDLRDKYDTFVTRAFLGDPTFERGLKESFESFVNVDQRAAMFLCTYLDDLLRSRVKVLGEEQTEALLEKVVVVFRYLQDKDVFENFYRHSLAKRLLSGRNASDDLERNVITKLKAECGYQFTSKLEGMFTDMRVSREIQEKFKANAGTVVGDVEMSVTVLTAGNWPSQQPPPCILPAEVEACCSHFRTFYFNMHSGRKLQWQTQLGTADLRARLGGRRYELNVSTYQMCMLMLFNKRDVFTFEQLCAETGVEEGELKRHVVSLLVPRVKLLSKRRRGKDLLPEDELEVNPEFKSKLTRVRVPLVSLKETTGSAAVPAQVDEDRRHMIEAAVVRIMKARKTLSHNDLVAEVTRQLGTRFKPSFQQIKLRIESLIEREYLERGEQDRRMYKYLA